MVSTVHCASFFPYTDQTEWFFCEKKIEKKTPANSVYSSVMAAILRNGKPFSTGSEKHAASILYLVDELWRVARLCVL